HVLLVPGLRENLLATDLLLEDKVDHACSRKTDCRFVRGGGIVARGVRERGPRYGDGGDGRAASVLGAEAVGRCPPDADITRGEREKDLMHQRFGHPGRKRFNKLMKDLGLEPGMNKGDEPCKVCVRAKKVKAQNHQKVPRAKKPMERIYVDFWGPYN